MNLVPSAHGDGDVVEGEAREDDREDDDFGVLAIDAESGALRLRSRIEDWMAESSQRKVSPIVTIKLTFDTVTSDLQHFSTSVLLLCASTRSAPAPTASARAHARGIAVPHPRARAGT